MTVQFAPIWNESGVDLTCIKANANDIASGGGSTLIDLLVNDVSKFSVNKSGLILSNGSTVPVNFSVGSTGVDFNISQSGSDITFNLPDASATARGLVTTGTQAFNGVKSFNSTVNFAGTNHYEVRGNQSRSGIHHSRGFVTGGIHGGYKWTGGNIDSAPDLVLERDDADIMAQRRSANAQTFRVYNAYTDASNYERGVFGWTGSILRIGTENAGTGSIREINFIVGNSFHGGAGSGSYAGIGSATGYSGNRAAWVGQSCNVAYYSSCLGWATSATIQFSQAIGAFCISDIKGRTSLCPGQGSINSVHASQRRSGTQTISAYTSNNTPRILTIPTTGQAYDESGVPLASNNSIVIQGVVLALRDDNTETSCWFIKALFQNNNGTITKIYENIEEQSNNSNVWGVSLNANNTAKTWEVLATGENGKNIRWDGFFICSQLTH